jgi:arylsulfatase A-like enzyme
LQDDLGFDDVAFNGNDRNLNISGNITQLAREGVILNRHYVHW